MPSKSIYFNPIMYILDYKNIIVNYSLLLLDFDVILVDFGERCVKMVT